MTTQLPLAIQLPDFASFDNYYVQSRNREPVNALLALAAALGAGTEVEARILHLCGAIGAGKTHLLYALCRQVRAHSLPAMYLSLCDPAVRPEHLEALPRAGVVCLDDLGTAAGYADWQRALLLLYEQMRDTQPVLVTAARYTPSALGFTLADLTSRMQRSVVYRIHALDDTGKAHALRLRAANRGLHISDEVVRYMLARYTRDEASLFALLDRMDTASLAAQRRITVPFLKTLE